MRKTVLVGGVLAVAAFLVVVFSNLLDLNLESVALLGVALGAVVAVVPDRSPLMRLAGFAAGVVLTWIGFVVRAALLPDTATARALFVALVIALCTVVAAVAAARIPLWSLLVGAAAMSGAYEYTYAAAPPELASTSVTAVTALLVTAAVGYLVVALTAPGEPVARAASRDKSAGTKHDDSTALDDMMEKTR